MDDLDASACIVHAHSSLDRSTAIEEEASGARPPAGPGCVRACPSVSPRHAPGSSCSQATSGAAPKRRAWRRTPRRGRRAARRRTTAQQARPIHSCALGGASASSWPAEASSAPAGRRTAAAACWPWTWAWRSRRRRRHLCWSWTWAWRSRRRRRCCRPDASPSPPLPSGSAVAGWWAAARARGPLVDKSIGRGNNRVIARGGGGKKHGRVARVALK